MKGILEMADNTGMDFSRASRYSKAKQQVMLEYLEAVDPSILELIDNAVTNPNNNWSKVVLMETIPDRLANDIKTILGIDASNYHNSISAGDIRHILAEHGPNGRSDHSMANREDIARIKYILDHYKINYMEIFLFHMN